MISCLAFLGNPGKQYEKTRHNLGFMVSSALNTVQPIAWQEKWQGQVGSLASFGRPIQLIRPTTYMNNSGQSVRKLLDFHRLGPDQLVVIHDDLEADFGTIRLRLGGGAAGHNGLRSLDQLLGSQQYYRLRIGIGRPVHGSVSDFVLSRFTNDEEIVLPTILQAAVDLLSELCAANDRGLAQALNSWSRRVVVN